MKYLLSIAIFLTTISLSAQKNLVKSGEKASKSGRYEKAIDLLTEALEDKGLLGRQELPTAYFYRAYARLQLIEQFRQTSSPGRLATYANGHQEVFEDLQDADQTDAGKFATQIQDARSQLFDLMLEAALAKINYSQEDNIPSLRRIQAWQDTRQLLEFAKRINNEHYLLFDLEGRLHLEQEQYEEALKAFRLSIKAFKKTPPGQPDLLAAYVYYRKALLHYHYRYQGIKSPDAPSKYDMDQALISVSDGIKMLEKEYTRVQESSSIIVPLKEYYQNQYESILIDFRNLQLDLYLQAKDRYNEAIRIFKEALRKDPQQYDYRIAYAQLLELSSLEMAEKEYRKAIYTQPDRLEAHYNLGVMYLNKASKLIDQAKKEERLKSYAELMSEARQLLNQAKPFFEKAHTLAPENLIVLNALIQISAVLDDHQAYKTYHEAKLEVLK